MKVLSLVICSLVIFCSIKPKAVFGFRLDYEDRRKENLGKHKKVRVEVKKVFEDALGQEYYDVIGLEKKNLKLVLSPNDHLITPSAELVKRHNGRTVSREKLANLHYYHGYVNEEHGSSVSVKIKDGYLFGIIVTNSHYMTISGLTDQSNSDNGLKHLITMRKHERKELENHVRPLLTSVYRRKQNRAISKRSTSNIRYLEGLLVADQSTIDRYGELTNQYVLLVADVINSVYQDNSIGEVKVMYVLTKVILATKDELDYAGNNIDDSTKLISYFKKWVSQFQNDSESSDDHFDHAGLLTKTLCGTVSCGINGRGYYSGMCKTTSIATAVAIGLGAGLVLAHEMGHNFGLGHDSGDCAKGYIMHTGLFGGFNAYRWSPCSRSTLQEWLTDPNKYSCLDDKVSLEKQKTVDGSRLGKTLTADQQCQLMYNSDYYQCGPLKRKCTILYCLKKGTISCYHRGVPPLEGTSCGTYMWCQAGQCVHEPIPPPINGNWGAWSTFSNCSSNCGIGIRYRTRECNNPKPEFYGEECVGDSKGHFETCNTADCPAGTPTYRDKQCSERDPNYVGYYDGKECRLVCRESSSLSFYGTVRDGTRCDNDIYNYDVCVGGKCKDVGCDRKFSHLLLDRCGICGGSGNTCKLVSSTKILKPAYKASLLFLTLPVGAYNALIEEQTSTYNDLGVKDMAGNWIIAPKRTSTVKYFAGAKIVYTRKESRFIDILKISGPLTEKLEIYGSRWYESSLNVKYSYYEPLTTPDDISSLTFYWNSTLRTCSETCAGGLQETISHCYRADDNTVVSSSNCDPGTDPAKFTPCNTQPCEPRWKDGPWSACSETCGPYGNRTRKIDCRQKINSTYHQIVENSKCSEAKDTTFEECNRVDCQPDWVPGPWSKCSKTKCQGIQTRPLYCKQLLATGIVNDLTDRDCVSDKPNTELICNPDIDCYVWKPVYGNCSQCDQGNEILSYTEVGCYKMINNLFGRSLRTFSVDPSNKIKAIEQCGKQAHNRARRVFALGPNGECFGSMDGHEVYFHDGQSTTCVDKLGGPGSVFVYGINSGVLVGNHSCFYVEDDYFVDDSYCTNPLPDPVLKLCCEEVCLEHCVPTETGEFCTIPFVYRGQDHYECVREGGKRWCSTTSNYDIDPKKVNCKEPCRKKTTTGECCSLPFIYRGRIYNDCIMCENCVQPWCSLTSNYDRDGRKGTCVS